MANKEKAGKTKKFRFKTKLSAADAAKFASDLAAGLGKGEVALHAEEQAVVLQPGGDLCMKIRAREKPCKKGKGAEGRLRIEIRYARKTAS